MRKQKKRFKEIERILAGERRSNTLKAGWDKETALNTDFIDYLLKNRKNMRWGQIVARLIRAGATRITIQNNPLWNKDYWWHDNFYIFVGYVEVDARGENL